MLEILSETKDPLRVQPHLKKCFEAINKLHFTDQLEILAMYSQEDEKVNFRAPVKTKDAGGSVEKWLVQVEEQMVVSVRDQILKSFKNYFVVARTQWVAKWVPIDHHHNIRYFRCKSGQDKWCCACLKCTGLITCIKH